MRFMGRRRIGLSFICASAILKVVFQDFEPLWIHFIITCMFLCGLVLSLRIPLIKESDVNLKCNLYVNYANTGIIIVFFTTFLCLLLFLLFLNLSKLVVIIYIFSAIIGFLFISRYVICLTRENDI